MKKYNYDTVLDVAAQYPSLKTFRMANQSMYYSALKQKFLDELIAEIGWEGRFLWSKELCYEHARKFKTLNEWGVSGCSSYDAASRYGWLNEIKYALFENTFMKKPNNHWTYEACKEDALKYDTKQQWRKESESAYKTAQVSGWLEDCSKHFITESRYPNGYWTFENILLHARQYRDKKSYMYSKSYKSAVKNSYLKYIYYLAFNEKVSFLFKIEVRLFLIKRFFLTFNN